MYNVLDPKAMGCRHTIRYEGLDILINLHDDLYTSEVCNV
jgi:hypothetical protein